MEARKTSDKCPDSHPEEFIYDIWPGTVQACNCLSREFKFSEFYPNKLCDRGKNGKHKSS